MLQSGIYLELLYIFPDDSFAGRRNAQRICRFLGLPAFYSACHSVMVGFNPAIHPVRVDAPKDSFALADVSVMDGRIKSAHDGHN
jgi:hypothetical protein